MVTRLRVASAATLVGCLIAVSAYAQEVTAPAAAPAPANLAYIDGDVEVVQDGVTKPADPPLMLIEGDIIRSRSGRAEIVFGDGTLLHLSHDGELEILGEERLRLVGGRAIVRVSHAAVRPYVIDTPNSSVRLDAEGEYGLTSVPGGRLEVAVTRGEAAILGTQQWAISGGQMLTLREPAGRPLIELFNSARFDAFASWSHDRATGLAHSASAAQLPYELRPYGPVLDGYGRWDYVEPHGYVWFPSVGVSWRPYYDGSWAFTRYGWTWHGRDRFAWPTHHFGRWGLAGASWYWIPATQWAPAWVTWSVAPGFVGWAPLGWHHPGRIDVWGRRDHPAYRPHHSPWRGWTVLPRQHFGARRDVRVHAVDAERLDDVARQSLLTTAIPTRSAAGVAVPRESAAATGRRGNVRRPLPPPPGRVDAPARAAVPPRANEPAPRFAPGVVNRGDAPSSRRSSSWSGTADRAAGSGGRGTSNDTSGKSSASERRGSVRNPGVRSAPQDASGRAPTGARSPASKSDGAGASRGSARAVPRSGASRPKG